MKTSLHFLLGWCIYTIVFSLLFFLKIQHTISTILFVLGLLVGFILPFFIDAVLPKISKDHLIVDKKMMGTIWKEGTGKLQKAQFYTDSQEGSLLRSYPLLGGYLVAAIVVATSSTSIFSKGFILGLGLFLIIDLVLSRNPSVLRKRWFSTFKTTFTDNELSYFVWGSVAVFIILSMLTLLV